MTDEVLAECWTVLEGMDTAEFIMAVCPSLCNDELLSECFKLKELELDKIVLLPIELGGIPLVC